MNVVAHTDYKLGWKLFLYPTLVGMAIVSAFSAVEALEKGDKFHLFVYAIPLFTGCIAGFIYILRHKIILTEDTLFQYGFNTKKILLEDVENISEQLGAHVIESSTSSIRITTDLKDKEVFKAKVLARILELDIERIYLPGRQLAHTELTGLLAQAHHLVDLGVENETLFETDASIFDELNEHSYYLIYEHMISSLNRAYLTELPQLQFFLAEYITPALAGKSDIWIMPLSLEWVIGCHRGGGIFFMNNMKDF